MTRHATCFALLLLPIAILAFVPHPRGVWPHTLGDVSVRNERPPRSAVPVVRLSLHGRQLQPNEQEPVVARVYSRALNAAIRCVTLFGKIDGLAVRCEAVSNRDAALGRISSLRIDWDRLSSPFLKSREFQLTGDNLELGFGPIVSVLVPFLLFWRRGIPLFLMYLLLSPRLSKMKQRKDKISSVRYSLGLSGDDLSRPNTLFRVCLHRAMDHLLRNSVVGVLAESALGAAKDQTGSTGTRLGGGGGGGLDEMSSLTGSLDESSTKLELKEVTIGSNNRILLDAVAVFPDPSSGTTSRLDFSVRLAVTPLNEDLIPTSTNNNPNYDMTIRPDGCGIMITNAELKASFNKDTLGIPLQIFGKPIPDIWIPVVSGGLAFPFNSRHRVVSVESLSEIDRIRICGEIYFNGDAPVLKKNNIIGWKNPFMGGTGGSSKRPSLPGSKN